MLQRKRGKRGGENTGHLCTFMSHSSTQHHKWCVQIALSSLFADSQTPIILPNAHTQIQPPFFTKMTHAQHNLGRYHTKIDGCLAGGMGGIRRTVTLTWLRSETQRSWRLTNHGNRGKGSGQHIVSGDVSTSSY